MSITGVQVYKKTEFAIGGENEDNADILIARPSWERKALIISAIIGGAGFLIGGAGVALGLMHIIPIAGSGSMVIVGGVMTATGIVVTVVIVVKRKLFEKKVQNFLDNKEEKLGKAQKTKRRDTERKRIESEKPTQRFEKTFRALEQQFTDEKKNAYKSLKNEKRIFHIFVDDEENRHLEIYFASTNKARSAIRAELEANGATTI